ARGCRTATSWRPAAARPPSASPSADSVVRPRSWLGSGGAATNGAGLRQPERLAQGVAIDSGDFLRLSPLPAAAEKIVGGLTHGIGGGKTCRRRRGRPGGLAIDRDQLDQLPHAKSRCGAHQGAGAERGGKFRISPPVPAHVVQPPQLPQHPPLYPR